MSMFTLTPKELEEKKFMFSLTPQEMEEIKIIAKAMPPLDEEDELSWIAGLLLQLNKDYLELEERVTHLESA